MKNILTHSLVALASIVLAVLLTKQCTPVHTVTETVVTRDTVLNEVVTEVHDTVYITRKITRVDTIHHEVPVVTVSEGIYSYNEWYEDSTYQVLGNMVYKGVIEGHHQMFLKHREQITLLPTTRTIYRNRDIFTTKIISRQPRLLVGAYSRLNEFKPEQIGINMTLVDNKFRQYTLGKDVLDPKAWMLQVQVPLFYSKN